MFWRNRRDYSNLSLKISFKLFNLARSVTSKFYYNHVEWIPPAHLDTGQARVNDYHRPERLLQPPDDEPVAHQPGRPETHEPGGPEPNAA